MEVLIAFVVLMAILGVAAARWGHNYNFEDWGKDNYDPRYNWQSFDSPATEPKFQEKESKLLESNKLPLNVTPVRAIKDFNLN